MLWASIYAPKPPRASSSVPALRSFSLACLMASACSKTAARLPGSNGTAESQAATAAFSFLMRSIRRLCGPFANPRLSRSATPIVSSSFPAYS